MITVGTKAYKYDEDKNLLMYRVLSTNNNQITLRFIGEAYIDKATGKKIKNQTIDIGEEEFNQQYIALNPDALMNFMLTTTDFEGMDIKDIYICVHKESSLLESEDPDLIIKQNCVSQSKNAFGLGLNNKTYIGDCVTKKTLARSTDKITDMFDYKTIDEGFQLAIYIDDTVATICDYIPKWFADKAEEYFNAIKIGLSKTPMITGCSDNLKGFMVDNSFMTAYRSLYNIVQLDFVIDIGVNRNSEGDLIFNKKQQKLFEQYLMQHVEINVILKYDKDVDIASIVHGTHGVFSDSNGEIYIISYTVISDIIDDDIAKAMRV